jgi:hypothetical protein
MSDQIQALIEIIDPSLSEPNRSLVIEAMNAVDLPNGERFMLEAEANAEDKARAILAYLAADEARCNCGYGGSHESENSDCDRNKAQ